jgi:hypothetical protein
MKNRGHILLVLTLTILLPIGAAQADWRTMLEDFKQAGKSLLPGAIDSEELDIDTIISGLKEALTVGSRRAIATVGQTDGFLGNPQIRIPLPPQVQKAGSLMRQLGLGSLADQFETSMNRAAEKAAPQATDIVIDAIQKMTIDDARQILSGPDDAATQYFREKTADRLADLFRPTIEASLNQVGSTRYYNQLNTQLSSVPVVGETLNLDLPDYVTGKALDGLFEMIAAEEKLIRDDPAARTTELLKQVFSR